MPNASATPLANPFVGLRAFEETEDYLFFGRSSQIGELLKTLSYSRFLAVIGSSGSGKSSLVKSGLLPAIYSGFMTVGSNWRAVSMRPGEDPIGYLARALATESTLYAGDADGGIPYEWIVESSLRRSENGLVQVYKDAHLPAGENLLIVVDQFEELFRFSRYEKEARLGKSDAIHFIQILLAAAQQKEYPVYVLLTMRADFLGDCAEFRGLPEAINEGQYLIPRMRRDEIREAITGPVAVSSATISQRLVTRLLNDLNNDTDQLPILQHAMMRTWDAWYRRNRHDTPIDFQDYEKIGTMKTALSQHADEAYAELSVGSEQVVCEGMFKALTDKAADVRGIRRPRSIADLCVLTNGTQAQVIKVVEVFRKKGRTFLVPPPNVALTEASIVDLSHESLMRVWDRLVKWIEEEAQSGDIYLRLANSAKLKERGERGLLKNPELEIALRWKEKSEPSAKWAEGYKADFAQAMAYLEESRKEDVAEKKLVADKEATRKRLVKAIFLLLGSLVVAAVILAVYFNGLKKEALEQKAIAETQRRKALKSDSATRSALDSLQKSENAVKLALAKEHQSDSLRQLALREAEASEKIAVQKQQEADSNAVVARQQTAETRSAKDAAEALLSKTQAQNKKIAANEYARLIREGPSEENRNKEEFYGRNYFLIYAHHFNQLERLIVPEDKAGYALLKNKLYYNNDLYKRLYDAFELQHSNEALKKEGPPKPGFRLPEAAGEGPRAGLKKDDKGLLNTVTLGNGSTALAYTLAKKGQEFTAVAVSDKKKPQVFCATNDNFIYVFNDKLERTDAIGMGTKVTALDFFEEDGKSIIYFGTASGYIGYILYDVHKKNQPVFENKLETEITAIQLFKHSPGTKSAGRNAEETFLLAAGTGSGPKVYKLDDNSLKPDKLLYGNELPYSKKKFGNITDARYDSKTARILLLTSTGLYSWNPFTDDLLDKLTEKFHPDAALLNTLQLY